MSWNYRIIMHPGDGIDHETWYGLHEVYYNRKKPTSWTTNPIAFVGEDGAEVQRSLAMALKDALCQPILVEDGDKLKELP